MHARRGQSPDNQPWWQTAVIYQIYPRSFADSNGDGVGDLRGIEQRLDYLSDVLGVDAIWISPFYRSPMRDFGYDVSDHTDVDPIFGTLADAEALIAAIHARGMRVILDFVSNHTSDEHPWFQESRSSRESPKRDWYIWRDPAPDGGPPNNWLASFGGPAWTFDERTGQYYLHSFLPSQPDLNWRNPQVMEAMHDVLGFWLERGVNGFRIDAAHFVGKDPEFRDNPPAPEGYRYFHKPVGEYDSQLHIYDRGTPFAHEVYQGIRRLVDEYGVEEDRLLIGEMHLYDWDEWASYFGPNLDEFHLPYNFGLLNVEWSAASIRELVRAIEDALPEGAWPNWVVGNHDEPRVASRLGPQLARTAMLLLLTLRGTPTVYYGDELGFVDADVPPEKQQDPWGLRMPGLNLSRDPARSPMLWTREPHGGFTAPDVTPWLPTIDPERYSVEAQLGAPGSMLEFTRALLQLRHERLSLHSGTYRELDLELDCLLAFERESGDEVTIVLASFAEEPVTVPLPGGARYVHLIGTESDAVLRDDDGGQAAVNLGPYGAVILDVHRP